MDQFFIDNPQYANPVAKNKAIYENWKAFTLDNKGVFEGIHNGFCAEITSRFKTEKSETTIKTSRQLQSAAGSIFPRIAQVTTYTYIKKRITYQAPIIKIKTNSLLNNLVNVWDLKNKKIPYSNHRYLIKANHQDICKKILKTPLIDKTLQSNQLVSFSSSSKQISITFKKVFKNHQEIQCLVHFLDELDAIFRNF